MADKQISQLVAATTINDEDLFVMQQGGTAKKLSGQKLADFVYQSAADQIERVDEAVEQAQAAVDRLEEQKNEIAQTIADMAELGTDTTLSTPGMAADAKAAGDRIKVAENSALANLEQATITDSQYMACIYDSAEDVPLKSLVVNVNPVQSGSGDPSPENVRPITGWTSVDLYASGVNILGGDAFLKVLRKTYNFSTSSDDNGRIISFLASQAAAVFKAVRPNLKLVPYRQYTPILRIKRSSAGYPNVRISYVDSANENFTSADTTYAYKRYVTNADKWFQGLSGANNSGTTYINVDESGFFEGNYRIDNFVPWKGICPQIDFPDEAGTVYGATLDITKGILTVTKGNIASYDGEELPGAWISSMDVYEAGATPTTGAQVVYDLAAPVVYNIDPVTVCTQLGTNYIWVNTGDIVKLTYYKEPVPIDDIYHTIESMISGVEETMEATQDYTAGQLFIAKHVLYKAQENIATGETFVPANNCDVTTVEEVINNAVDFINQQLIGLGNVADLSYEVVT